LAPRDLSIGEVADQLGYRDVYFFSRQFKKYAGCAPGKYRPKH
jgi:iron complex transport system substrate-binding protein